MLEVGSARRARSPRGRSRRAGPRATASRTARAVEQVEHDRLRAERAQPARPSPASACVPTTSWPALDELRDEPRADRAGCPCDEDSHRRLLFGSHDRRRGRRAVRDTSRTTGCYPVSRSDGEPRGAAAVPVRDRLPDARLGRPRRRTSSRTRSCATTRPASRPESPKAYLATVTTRLAIDQLRSARARREVYPGEWLPEPLVDDEAVRHAETADSLSLAFLHLLEKLSPVERAVFLLREVFDYPYDEVARDRRQEPRELPPDPRPRAPARRGGPAPLRRLARGAGRGRAPLPRGVGGGRHRRRSSSCSRPTRRSTATAAARRRPSGAARRRGARREGADRLGPAGARARDRRIAPALVNGEPGLVFYDPDGRRAGSPRSRSPTASSSPSARCSTRTSSRTSRRECETRSGRPRHAAARSEPRLRRQHDRDVLHARRGGRDGLAVRAEGDPRPRERGDHARHVPAVQGA